MIKRFVTLKASYLMLLMLISPTAFACCSKQQGSQDITQNIDSMKVKITVGKTVFSATLLDNATAKAFKAMLPLTINMAELNANEKYVDLPESLPANASNPGSIESGDLMLYGSRTLVLFYISFSTSYAYTKIGSISNATALAAALGSGNVTVKFKIE